MKHVSSILTLIVMLVACAQPGSDPAKSAAAGDPAPTPKADDPAAPDASPAAADAEATADADPWQAKLESRTLAGSGLDVGSKLSPFDIVEARSGERYCQVCRFGSDPKIMAVGTADDEGFKEDIRDLDAIARKYEGEQVRAFAVVTELRDGKAVTPADPEAARAAAEALRKELDVTIPIVVPATDDTEHRVWDEYYNITASRTVMFADGHNDVKWSAVGPEDYAGLDAAIRKVVGES